MIYSLRKLNYLLPLCYLSVASAEMTVKLGKDSSFASQHAVKEAIFETIELKENSLNEAFAQRCNEKCEFSPSCLGFTTRKKDSKVLCHLLNKKFTGIVNEGLSLLSDQENAPLDPSANIICKLRVTNSYPYTTPRDAPYYGSHADWLEVRKEGLSNNNECAYYKKSTNPAWCKYKGNKAEINHEEAPSEDEILKSETLIVKYASGKRTVIDSYHYFFDADYYTNYEGWNDHMLAPEVKIMNLSSNPQTQVGITRKHPTNKLVSTHVKNDKGGWDVNPNYEGNMKIVISCSESCFCKEDSFETSKGDMYYETNDGEEVDETNDGGIGNENE